MTGPPQPTRPDEVETIEPLDPAGGRRAPLLFWLTILAHPHPARVGERAALFRGAAASPVALSRLDPPFQQPAGGVCEPLESPFLSRKPVWLAPASGGGVLLSPADDGTEVRVSGDAVLASRKFCAAELRQGVVLELARRVVLMLHTSEKFDRCPQRLGFIGESAAMERLRVVLLRVAGVEAPVLLEGESGSGKEIAARAIHQSGPRSQKPFVSVNLAALPASTAVSELFGHAAGSFTGATGEHHGYFQQADGGSLFLDEIGLTTPELQAALLRVLDSGEIQPLGACGQRKVDVRVLAATDVNLEAAMQAGGFRASLFHRLSACRLQLPPLRERRDDVGRLLFHFLAGELEAAGLADRLLPNPRSRIPWLPAGLVARLAEYSWPGNVRQLNNVARQMVIDWGMAEAVDAESILARIEAFDAEIAPSEHQTGLAGKPADISDDELVEIMRRNRFGIQSTARELGISRTTLYALIERCSRLRKAKDIGREELIEALDACGRNLDSTAERLQISKKALKLRLKDLGLA